MGPKRKKQKNKKGKQRPQLCILEIPMTFASQAAQQSAFAALAASSRKEAVKNVVFSGQRQVAQSPWFSPRSAAPAPALLPVLEVCWPA